MKKIYITLLLIFYSQLVFPQVVLDCCPPCEGVVMDDFGFWCGGPETCIDMFSNDDMIGMYDDITIEGQPIADGFSGTIKGLTLTYDMGLICVSGGPNGTTTLFIQFNDGACLYQSQLVMEIVTDINISEEITPETCAGDTDASVNITVLNGVAPYGYEWSDGETTEDRNNISNGSYSLTITDSNGCSDIKTIVVQGPDPMMVAITETCEMTFNPGCDAVLDYSITGGSAPYTITVDSSGTNVPADLGSNPPEWTSLCDGQYTIVVTDSDGCSVEESFIICVPQCDVEVVVDSVLNVACFGESTGVVEATIGSSFDPINWQLEQGGLIIDSGTDIDGFVVVVSNLPTAAYKFSVTDAIGCEAEATFSVQEPTELVIDDCVGTPVTTVGGSDGSAEVFPSGGTPGYTYLWSNNQTVNPITGLTPGQYGITVTDDNGCTAEGICTVQDVSCADFNVDTDVTQPLCNGQDGDIGFTVSGGEVPYTFTGDLADVGNTDPYQTSFSGSAGSYSFTVTDNQGCSEELMITITEPTALTIAGQGQNVTCFGDMNGSIDNTTNGGTPPYSYSWNDDPTTDEDRINLGPGNYIVFVTDDNGCTSSASTTIDEPALLVNGIDSIKMACTGSCDGIIDINPMGGIAPYSITWSGPGGFTGSNSDFQDGLCAGQYDYTVTDQNGCSFSSFIIVNEGGPSFFGAGQVNTVNICVGSGLGSQSLTVNSGSPPYSYLWSNGSTSNPVTFTPNLLGGDSYAVTVTDDNGCTATGAWNVEYFPEVFATIDPDVDTIFCLQGDSLICLNGSGGVPGYTYLWPNTLETTQCITTDPNVDMYVGVVIDQNFCTANDTIYTQQASSCDIDIMYNGANLPFDTCFAPIVGCPLKLAFDMYTVRVPDRVFITENGNTIYDSDFFSSDGNFEDYKPSGSLLDTVVLLPGNTYCINVEPNPNGNTVWELGASCAPCDENTCECFCPVYNPVGIIDICLGETLEATGRGGLAPYTYSWSNGSNASSVVANTPGVWTVEVTDANGCVKTNDFFVNDCSYEVTMFLDFECESDTVAPFNVTYLVGMITQAEDCTCLEIPSDITYDWDMRYQNLTLGTDVTQNFTTTIPNIQTCDTSVFSSQGTFANWDPGDNVVMTFTLNSVNISTLCNVTYSPLSQEISLPYFSGDLSCP